MARPGDCCLPASRQKSGKPRWAVRRPLKFGARGLFGELQALLGRLFARRDAEAGRMAAKSAE